MGRNNPPPLPPPTPVSLCQATINKDSEDISQAAAPDRARQSYLQLAACASQALRASCHIKS